MGLAAVLGLSFLRTETGPRCIFLTPHNAHQLHNHIHLTGARQGSHLLRPRTPDPVKHDLGVAAMNKAGLLGFSDAAPAPTQTRPFPIGNLPGTCRGGRPPSAREGNGVGSDHANEPFRIESKLHCVTVPIKSERLRRSSDLSFLPSNKSPQKHPDLVVSPNQAGGLAHAPRTPSRYTITRGDLFRCVISSSFSGGACVRRDRESLAV